MQFSIKNAIRIAAFTFRKSWATLLAITILVFVIDTGIHYFIKFSFEFHIVSDLFLSNGKMGPLSYALIVFSHLLLAFQTAAITETTFRAVSNQPASLQKILHLGVWNAFPVLIVTYVYCLGSAMAGLLLLVPGLLFATAFSIVIPVLISERGNIVMTFSRAYGLTKGHRWRIFVTWLVLGVSAYILNHRITGTGLFSELHPFFPELFPEDAGFLGLGSLIENPIAQYIFLVWTASLRVFRIILNAGIYLTLRHEKEDASGTRRTEVSL